MVSRFVVYAFFCSADLVVYTCSTNVSNLMLQFYVWILLLEFVFSINIRTSKLLELRLNVLIFLSVRFED